MFEKKNIHGSASWKRLLTHAGAADALFVSGAIVVSSAVKVTHTILTREARWTVPIPLASRWHPVALHLSFSGEVRWAGALFPVVHHLANGADAARLLFST